MNHLFSIIIPSFNQGRFIAQTIDSILSQSYKNVEIIIMDGGSTDETLEILASYGDKIFWKSEKDRGQTHAINKGIALAKGDIIAYLNSDDYYLEDAFNNIVESLHRYPDAFWLSGDYIIVDKNGRKIHSFVARYKLLLRKFLSFNMLAIVNPVIQPSTFLTRRLILEIGLFNEELRYTMDYEYWLRAMRTRKPVIIDKKLSAFRIHKASKGGSDFKRQFDEELIVAKKFRKNPVLIWLHSIHNKFIGVVYRAIK